MAVGKRERLVAAGAAVLLLLAAAFTYSRDRVVVFPGPGGERCAPDNLRCLLEARADAERRIVVTASNAGDLPLLLNLLVSWDRLDLHNYVVVALDDVAAAYLRRRGVPCYHAAQGERSSAAAGYGTAAFSAITKRKNVVVLEILRHGYAPFFTDADTVWLVNPLDEDRFGPEPVDGCFVNRRGDAGPSNTQAASVAVNPYLDHRCSELRLGDSVAKYGEPEDPQALSVRADCADMSPAVRRLPVHPDRHAQARCYEDAANGTVRMHFPYDVKGMYGDINGLDTGYWYARPTNATIAHLELVVEWQSSAAARPLHDQECFNEPLKPYHALQLTPLWPVRYNGSAGSAWAGQTLAQKLAHGRATGHGPAHLKVAFFDPLDVPNGCRFSEAVRRPGGRDQLVMVHANCKVGLVQKVYFLYANGFWQVPLWDDYDLFVLIFCGGLVAGVLSLGLHRRALELLQEQFLRPGPSSL